VVDCRLFVVALLANSLRGLARASAIEAERRPTRSRSRRTAADGAAPGRDVGGTRRSSSEVFSTVVAELASCLDVRNAALFRYEPDGTALLLAAADEPGLQKMPVGERFSLDGENVAAMVRHGGRAARMDSHDHAAGTAAARIRALVCARLSERRSCR